MRSALRPGMRVGVLGYAVSVAVILALWQYGSSQAIIPLLFPSPLSTWRTAMQLLHEGRLVDDIAASLTRIAIGFAVGSVAGVVLGVLMGSFRTVRLAFEPEPGIVVPVMMCLPGEDAVASDRRPAVLVVDEGGKQVACERGLIDAILSKGLVVLAIDYRGAGETAGTVPAIEYGPGTPEYNPANYSLFIGRPLAGARVADIRRATDFLANRPEVDASRISMRSAAVGSRSARSSRWTRRRK